MATKKNIFIQKLYKFFHWEKDPDVKSIAHRNEVNANKIVTIANIVLFVLALIYSILYFTNVFGVDYKYTGSFSLLLVAVILATAGLISIFRRGKDPWIKYVLISAFLFGVFLGYVILGSDIVLLFLIPLVTCCLYYSEKLVTIFTFATMLANVGGGILNILYDTYGKTPDQIAAFYSNENIRSVGAAIGYFFTEIAIADILFIFVTGFLVYASSFRGRKLAAEQLAISEKNSRLNSELTLASQIQQHLVPTKFPAFPDHKEFDIFASMNPAKEVGGDFYDFFMVDDNNLIIIIGDVSGKGVPSSLFMATAKTLIKDHANMGIQLAEVFTRVNNLLCAENFFGLFVTAWMARINLKTGVMTYVNAGHNPPLIRNGINESFKFLHCNPGFILGGLESIVFKQYEMKLEPNSKILLYTDGITEATNQNQMLYGEERLIDFLNVHSNDSIEQTIKQLIFEVNLFSSPAPQFDDETVLMLHFIKLRDVVEQTFDAKDEQLPIASKFVLDLVEKNGCLPKALMQLEVAFEELFVNVCHYAYKERDGKVSIEVEFFDNKVKILFKDRGIPFDPFSKNDPDINLPASQREIGGLGIYLVKQTMDSMEYQYKDSMNMLTIIKTIKE